MKKILIFIFLIVSCISLSSCESLEKRIYDKFITKYDEFISILDNGNQYTVEFTKNNDPYQSYKYVSGKLKVINTPAYVEATFFKPDSTENYVYYEKNEVLYKATLNKYGDYYIEDYSKIEDIDISQKNIVKSFVFDNEVGTVKKDGDYYVFTQKVGSTLKNITTDIEYSGNYFIYFVKSMYKFFDISLEGLIIKETEIVSKIKIEDDYLHVFHTLKGEYERSYLVKTPIYKTIEIKIKLESFPLISIEEIER